jgi:outer membrane protein
MIKENSMTPYSYFGKVIFLAFFLIFPFGNSASGQENKTFEKLSLEQARSYAAAHSIEMQTARADLQIANRQVWEITATGLPQVNASVGYQYFLDVPTSLIPAEFFGGNPGEFEEIQFGTEQNLSASLTVNQMIFDGSYIVGLRASRIFRELASQNMKRSEIEVRNMVTETYLLSLMASQNLDIVRQNLINMERSLFETIKIYEAGFTDPINVDQLKLAVSNMKSTIANLERQNQITVNLLKFQLGMDMSTDLELTDSLEGLFGQLSLEAGLYNSFNPDQHIDFQIMKSQEGMSLMTLRREQSFYLPSLSASFTRQEMAMRNEFNFAQSGQPWFPTTFFAINLNIPIFSSGFRSSRVSQKSLELEKSKLATLQVSQSLELQMQRAISDWQAALEKYQNEKDNLGLAERILDRTKIMQREGLASSLELTQANDQYLTTQANYLNSLFELLNAKNNIEKAAGR